MLVCVFIGIAFCKSYAQEIVTSGLKIIPTACGSKTGQITGLEGPADYAYQWLNSAGTAVGFEINLKNVGAGNYRLVYTDVAASSTKTFGPVAVPTSSEVIDITNVVVKPSTCGAEDGSVTNLAFKGTVLSCKWSVITGETATFITDNTQLTGAAAGLYSVTATNSNGCSSTFRFTIGENSDIVLNYENAVVKDAVCGTNSGSITNIKATSAYLLTFSWRDQNLKKVSSSLDLKDQPAGIYTLYATGGVNGECVSTYGPVAINNIGGLTIDSSQVVKVADDCTITGASIKDIHVVGTGQISYTWYYYPPNGQPEVAGTKKDLLTVTGGRYALQVTDQSDCGPVFSKMFYLRPYTGFKFYPELVKVTKASCESYAGITGVQEQQYLTGQLKYEWKTPNLQLVSTKPNLTGMPGGRYLLFVSDLCGKTPPLQFSFDMGDSRTSFNGVYRYTLKNSCLLKNTGYLSIDAYPPGIKKLRWVNGAGDTFASGPLLEKLGPGNYTLYVTDELGCERLYGTFPVLGAAPVQIVEGSGNLNADTCNTNTGSITNLQFVNGYPPFDYTWRNAGGKVIGKTADITGLSAGTYTLSVSDGTGCDGPTSTFNLGNVNVGPPAPLVNDTYVCTSGETIFRVADPKKGSRYRLYETAESLTPIDEQTSGEFRANLLGDREFYISRIRGECEGPRARINLKIGLIITDLTNAFTPNGDGINDFWKINNVEKYTDALIKVFNRAGQLIFQSRGYGKPFTGTYNGKSLPNGVYYYIITLDRGCQVTGNISIMR